MTERVVDEQPPMSESSRFIRAHFAPEVDPPILDQLKAWAEGLTQDDLNNTCRYELDRWGITITRYATDSHGEKCFMVNPVTGQDVVATETVRRQWETS